MKNIFYILILVIISLPAVTHAVDDDFLEDAEVTKTNETVDLPAFTIPAPNSNNENKVKDTKIISINESAKENNGIVSSDTINNKSNYIPFDGINSETLNNPFDSLFFTREQIDFLYSKIKIYKTSGRNLDTIINNIKDTAQKAGQVIDGYKSETTQAMPVERVFRLDSILFPVDGNWTIWLNENKIRKLDAENIADYVIKNVDENFITIFFFAKDLNIDSPNFRNILTFQGNSETNVKITDKGAVYNAIDKSKIITVNEIKEADYNWDYKSNDGRIWVATADNLVKITLKLRQEFKLSNMAISEGGGVKNDDIKDQDNKVEGSSASDDKIDDKPNDLDVLDPNKPITSATPTEAIQNNNQATLPQQQIPTPLPIPSPVR